MFCVCLKISLNGKVMTWLGGIACWWGRVKRYNTSENMQLYPDILSVFFFDLVDGDSHTGTRCGELNSLLYFPGSLRPDRTMSALRAEAVSPVSAENTSFQKKKSLEKRGSDFPFCGLSESLAGLRRHQGLWFLDSLSQTCCNLSFDSLLLGWMPHSPYYWNENLYKS